MYVKNIILGTINGCIMKILKESVEKISSQKKKKDFGQMITSGLVN